MENNKIAINISGVKKMYKLGQIGGGTLQGDLQSWWAKVRGKEDPNTKIGQDQRLVGKTFMALNGIDMTVYKGEALGIIGGNGAGKSTLLKLLSRVTAPTEGEIDIYGRIASMLEVGTGFNGEMTGRENVYMNGAILGMTKSEIDAKMEQIIEFSEVREFIDTPVKRYSSGMYVKLAFSVAAHLDSEIMIMDEVLAVGDMKFQQKCLNKMREAAKSDGRTVLYVSHNMNTIRQLCDRCVVLEKGKVVFQGDVEEAINRYIGTNLSVYRYDFDILSGMRAQQYSDPTVSIEHIYVACKNGYINYGEKLNFNVKMHNKLQSDIKVYLRVMIKAPDGTIVTMSASDNDVYLTANSIVIKQYCVDTSRLVPSNYSISFVIYEIGELAVDRNIDVLRDIYSFTVKATQGFNHNMAWNPQWWGYTSNGYLQELK